MKWISFKDELPKIDEMICIKFDYLWKQWVSLTLEEQMLEPLGMGMVRRASRVAEIKRGQYEVPGYLDADYDLRVPENGGPNGIIRKYDLNQAIGWQKSS